MRKENTQRKVVADENQFWRTPISNQVWRRGTAVKSAEERAAHNAIINQASIHSRRRAAIKFASKEETVNNTNVRSATEETVDNADLRK